MRDILFRLQPSAQTSLQAQIREKLVSAIVGGQLPADVRLPSSRQLAKDLGVSRNTVTLAYISLIDDGFLVARERSGYFVNPSMLNDLPKPQPRAHQGQVDWDMRFRITPSQQTNIAKPADWTRYPYPFIYGQVDYNLFPIAEWRDCSRLALGRKWLDAWTADKHASDDPMLVEQIRTRLLPRRGIMANEDEILVTLGAQQALYMLASLLVKEQTTVAIENPGYSDIRNMFRLRTSRLLPSPVDQNGLIVDERLAAADIVFTTPSHQAPTTVTMPELRRMQLLELAAKANLLVIEDDYEFESNFVSAPLPALKSLDREGRVIYVGSLSKTLFPGLRLGYLVGSPELIAEARALRRLMLRHPPSNNQRVAALFLSLGHHDAMLARLRKALQARWREIGRAMQCHMPEMQRMESLGGSSTWVCGPGELDSQRLAREALLEGVLLEPGGIYFAEQPPPQNCFRLGFSSIDIKAIDPGIERLAQVARRRLSASSASASTSSPGR